MSKEKQRQEPNKHPIIKTSLEHQLTNEVIMQESVNYCFEAINPLQKLPQSAIPLVNNCINTYLLGVKVGDEIMSLGM